MPARTQRGHGLTRKVSGRRRPVRSSNPGTVPQSTFLWMTRIYHEITDINANLVSTSDPSVWPNELLLKVGLIKRLYQTMEQILLCPNLGDSYFSRIE